MILTLPASSNEKNKKELIEAPGQLPIPSGQFAVLITKEILKVPDSVIGLISIKFGQKFRGLVNISGFHVDPGFEGRLKFSVYNAGAQSITLSKGEPVFLIFFSDLDRPADPPYRGEHQNQLDISSKDVMEIQGRLASPHVLDDRVKKLEHSMVVLQALIMGGILLVVGLEIKSCADKGSDSQKGLVQINMTPGSLIVTQGALLPTAMPITTTSSGPQIPLGSPTPKPASTNRSVTP